jgi:WXXGXW repeat (2 copies)
MRIFRSVRLMLLALLVAMIPISSYAGVFISVGFAPPVLPVYEQPICPEPGLMWTPGYWAYGPDGYYWVPGAWVEPPYDGALWTPGYWGWGSGLYVWHPGYWGRHVGYYGGVNYGFGYMGVGFVGGMWRGGVFAYNRAVMHVGYGGGWGGNRVYSDRTIVERNTIINERHVAYEGGPGGIRHEATPQERMAEHEQHMARTSFQTQHMDEAMHNRSAYFNNNHGRPATMATARPLGREMHAAPEHMNGGASVNAHGNAEFHQQPQSRGEQQYHGAPQSHAAPQYRAAPEQRAAPQYRAAPEQRAAPQYRAAPEQRAAPQYRAAPEQRAAPQYRAAPEQRAEPQQHAAPRPEGHAPERRAPEGHAPEGHGGGHEDHGHGR